MLLRLLCTDEVAICLHAQSSIVSAKPNRENEETKSFPIIDFAIVFRNRFPSTANVLSITQHIIITSAYIVKTKNPESKNLGILKTE